MQLSSLSLSLSPPPAKKKNRAVLYLRTLATRARSQAYPVLSYEYYYTTHLALIVDGYIFAGYFDVDLCIWEGHHFACTFNSTVDITLKRIKRHLLWLKHAHATHVTGLLYNCDLIDLVVNDPKPRYQHTCTARAECAPGHVRYSRQVTETRWLPL